MSQFDSPVANLLTRCSLIKQIENIAGQQNINYLWQSDQDLKFFIKHLQHHVPRSEKDWREDDTFLALINDVNNQIITQLNDGEKDMVTATELAKTGTGLSIDTKFIIAAGVLSFIALYIHIVAQGINLKRVVIKKMGVLFSRKSGEKLKGLRMK